MGLLLPAAAADSLTCSHQWSFFPWIINEHNESLAVILDFVKSFIDLQLVETAAQSDTVVPLYH